MVVQARNLYDAATGRGRVMRQGDIACIVMDGAGAMIVGMQDFMQAQKWAQSRLPSANMLSDRARFMDQFQVLISRPGSLQSTRGNDRQLERLAKSMAAAGYDLSEWTLPLELKSIGHAPPPEPVAKLRKDAASASPNVNDDDGIAENTPPDPAGDTDTGPST